MENIEISFGKVLKKYRIEKKLSQEKLALMSDIDRTYISMMERGKRVPSISIVFKLANTLGIKASEMIKELEDLITEC